MEVSIRQAARTDLSTLLSFEQLLIEAERPFDPTLKTSSTHYYNLEKLVSDQDVEFLVAEHEGVIIGCGYARIESSKPYLQHEQHAYLGFMYVDPLHRGKGINAKLMDRLKSWALSNGLSEMRLLVYDKNASAIKAYQKFGFTEHMIEMRMGI